MNPQTEPEEVAGGGPRVRPPQDLVRSLRRALEFAYTGSAEHGAFLRNGSGEYVPSPFLLLNQLAAQLAECRGARDALQQHVEELRREHGACLEGEFHEYCEELRGERVALTQELAAWRSRGQALVAQLEKLPRYSPSVGIGGVPMGHLKDASGEWVLWRDVQACADALAALLRAPQLTTDEKNETNEDKKI